jgi:hypothetical protein
MLRDEIHKLEAISTNGTFRWVLDNEVDLKAIEDAFKRINEATEAFQVRAYVLIRL